MQENELETQSANEISKLIIQTYAGSFEGSYYSQFNYIDKWLYQDTDQPFLITGQPLSGKKTFICSYLNSHVTNAIILYQFSSINRIYSQALYKTMNSLRYNFNIEQKVELNEQKLRRYFKYWLEITSNYIQKEYIGYTKKEKKKLIILFEGIDEFIDSKGNHVLPSFWIPASIPKNIKLIMTANKASLAAQNLENSGVALLEYGLQEQKKQKVLNKLGKLKKYVHKMNLNELKIFNHLCMKKIKFQPNCNNFNEMIHLYIQEIICADLNGEQIKAILLCLVLSKTGLKRIEIQSALKLSNKGLECFYYYFSPIFTQFEGYSMVCQRSIRQNLKQLIDPQGIKTKNFHHLLNNAIKKQTLSPRKMQEQIHHLLASQNYIELKQVLSTVENFLVLYTPNNKYCLCYCWLKLQTQQQYDPVFEYNQGIESFLNHYYPKQEDMFKIIFQISLFFKEYSEFQNSKTPEFRHPFIQGQSNHLHKISIFEEFKAMKMVNVSNKSKKNKKQKIIKKNKNNIKQQQNDIQNKIEENKIENLGQMSIEQNNNRNIEKLNISILSNQLKFKQFYLHQMQDYINEYYISQKKTKMGDQQANIITNYQSDSDDEIEQKLININKIKNSLLLKTYSEYQDQNYHRNGEKLKYYYYKQWIWLQFPWICQSLKSNFSKLIQQCMKSCTQYMSIKKEEKLIKDAMKIIKVAKQSKLNIYNKAQIDLLPLKNHYNHHEETIVCSKVAQKSSKQSQLINIAKFKLNSESLNRQLTKINCVSYRQQNSKFSKRIKKQRNSTVFMTEAQDHKNIIQSRLQLPQLVSSSLRNSKISGCLSQRNNVKKYNALKYENQKLSKRIEEIKKTCLMMDSYDQSDNIEKLEANIDQSQSNIVKINRKMQNQKQLKEKLQTILKICHSNKMHSSDTEKLSYFLNSLKQMSKLQQEIIQKTKLKTIKMIQSYRTKIKELKQNYLESVKENKKEKTQFGENKNITKRKNNINHNINTQSEEIKPKNNDPKRKNIRSSNMVQSNYQQLKTNLGIVYGEEDSNNKIMEQLKSNIEKKNELEMKKEEINYEISEREEQLENLIEEIEGKQIQQQLESNSNENYILERQKLQRLRQRKQFLNKLLQQNGIS